MSTKAKEIPAQTPHEVISLLRGTRPARIILMDDEQFVRDAMKMMMEFYFKDYVTVECADGDKCWSEISRNMPDLLITDYGHTGMRLETMFPLLRRNQLRFPIIIASAYVSGMAELQKRLVSQPGLRITLLNKPFLAEDLKTRVIACLNGSESSSERHAEKEGEHPLRRRSSSECKPLLDAATKDLFRKNAFRITGLSVDATTREISRHADKLKMLAELGQDPHTQSAALPMKPPPTLDEIREAIQKLKDPEKRLIDEFFWFWPEQFGKSQSDPAIQALAKGDLSSAIDIWSAKEKSPEDGVVASHNLALVFHITALDWENYSVKNEVEAERRQKIADYWKGAFKRWELLTSSEHFWDKLTARIRQLNEPNLPTGFARRMRATLPEALDKINAELAVSFAQSGKIEFAKLHIRFMRETHQGLDNVEKTAELVLTPARNRLREQIRRAKDRADKDPRDAANAARELLDQARQTLDLFDLFFDKENDLRSELFDEVAGLCNQLPVAYHKATGDDKTCLEILKAVLPFATSMDLRQQIEKNISTLSGNLSFKQLEPVYAFLKTIQDSKEHPRARLETFSRAAVTAINGAVAGLPHDSEDRNELFDSAAIILRGISLEAWNTHQDRTTAIAANDLAIKYACAADLKARLREDQTTLRQVAQAQEQQHKSSNNTGIGCLVVVAIFIVLGVIGSCDSTNNSSRSNSYTPPASTPPLAVPSAPAFTPPTFDGGNSDGKVYRVPSSASSTLASEKATIESERTTLEALEAQIDKLGREIERERIYLDRTSQYAVDAFNSKVERYNALSQRAKIANAAFNERVDNYNAKLQRYGR